MSHLAYMGISFQDSPPQSIKIRDLDNKFSYESVKTFEGISELKDSKESKCNIDNISNSLKNQSEKGTAFNKKFNTHLIFNIRRKL